MQTIEELTDQIKEQIIECLHLEEVYEDLDIDMPLFGEETGLDSIDALEVVVLLEKNYGIKIEDAKVARKILYNVRTIAAHVEANRVK
ncbi:MAG TPA: phosphopantetheine-binding protein [Syntrophales bacterium]|jgi:acyl carrier protein|nr:phosphopantetheine-binding protein [Syntrophales bacterium]HPX56299.1 phosphopantetheine-binding protein [Syntrophales bacterium]